jgi:predicted RNA-binding protein YlqC (UPF0109 family)
MKPQLSSNSLQAQETTTAVLAGIVRCLVQCPNEVTVASQVEADRSRFTVEVNANDLEGVVGPGGRTVRSLQVVVSALGKRKGQTFTVDIKPHNS